MGAAEIISFDAVRARKQWESLRQQLHARFDQWLDRLEEQWPEAAPALAAVTEMVWDLRQALTGSLTVTLVAHTHQDVTTWLRAQRVDTHLIDPGSPWQHGHHERCNGVWRAGCLKRWRLTSVAEARRIMTHWREEYNNARPHGALDGLTPRAFVEQCSGPVLEEAA